MHTLLEYLALRGGISVYDGVKKGKQGKELVEHATEHAINNAVGETITNAIQIFWLVPVLLLAIPLFILAPVPGIAVIALAHHNVALIMLGILLIPLGFWLWWKFAFAAKRWMKRKPSWQFSEELNAERIAWSEQYGLPQEPQPFTTRVPNLAAPRQIEK